MVRTGASSYIRYDWEDTFGTAAFNDSTDKAFGLNTSLTNWTLNTSPKDLPQLGQTEISNYAYGQQNGSLGVDFTLSNPWIFSALLGQPTKTGSSAPYTYTWGTANSVSGANTVDTFSTEVGFQYGSGGSDKVVRQAKGCILNSLSIGTTIDGTVDCSADISYGKEGDDTTTYHASPPVDDLQFPYTFAHGSLKWHDGSSLATVAELQSSNITLGQNTSLLYSLGSNSAVSSFRRVFDITGNFQASWTDNTIFRQLIDQLAATNTETIPEASNIGVELLFTNNQSGAAEKSIKVSLNDVRPDSIAINGIVPNEPVFETINWRAKTMHITAVNAVAAAL
tara:strand:- start:3 stop:1016 length:1014 start_codon:yes stop_codon:yes gene_type:complete